MFKVIMIGCDLHDRSMLLRFACKDGKPEQASFANDSAGRAKMVRRLQTVAKKEQADRIVFVYEAYGQGFGLCDFLLTTALGTKQFVERLPPVWYFGSPN